MPAKKEVTASNAVETAKATKAAKKPVKAVKSGGLSVPAFSLLGKQTGTIDLPKDIFGAKVNKTLLGQVLRIYLNNQKSHFSNTKTRGEVEGSTRKIYKQKGTGGARHGARRAPIFVGGGIALGPKSRKVTLDLPKKMKKAALISALAQKMVDNEVFGILGSEKATGKTKEISSFVKALNKKTMLLVTDEKQETFQRGSRNIKAINYTTSDQINAFEVIKHQVLVLTKEAAEKLQAKLLAKEGIEAK